MRRKILGVVLLLIVFMTGFWGVADAQSFRSGNTTGVSSGETVNSTLWVSGRTINIAGEVNGDVFCAGQTVTISGTIEGDVICAAQSVTISGEVNGSLRIAAQTLNVSGTTGRSISAVAQTFTQGNRSVIGRDVSLAANDVVLDGSVGRDIAISANVININGNIGRNTQAVVSSLNLGSSAEIAGDLNYTSEQDVNLENGAVVNGKTSKSLPKNNSGQGARGILGSTVGFALYAIAASLIITLILIILFPQGINAIAKEGFRSLWKSLLVGLVAAVVVPALAILAMLTVVGLPFALLLLLTWAVVHAFAGVVSAYYLGRVVWRKQRNPIVSMVIGTILLIILLVIPFVGIIVWIAAMLLGIGMILLAIKHARPKSRFNLEPKPAEAKS